MPKPLPKPRRSQAATPRATVPQPTTAPEHILRLCRALAQNGAVEVLYLRGAADVATAYPHAVALDEGLWVLARFPAAAEPLDGHISVYLAANPKEQP